MEANVLRQIEAEDVVFYAENQYAKTERSKYRSVFDEMVAGGQLTGSFEDVKWKGFSGVKSFFIDFAMDELEYRYHIGKEFGISYATMQDMLRCYAIYILGSYIFATIGQKITWIKQFLTSYGERYLIFPSDAEETLRDFMLYIGTQESLVDDIIRRIHFKQAPKSKPRELSHMINYLAIANEINEMYQGNISDEDFKKWFPIFFWTNITFIIPLRATEMLVTPFNCIRHDENGRTYIMLRRTMLKGHKSMVHYEVEKDYKEFTYEIPNTWVVEAIELYMELTSGHKRKYLFDHTKYMINNIVSLPSFNMLLGEFVNTYLVGNPKYDYARYATGIKEFEMVTAGDSRPIAMANLFFQDISADICRQLADHSQISTSFGYYENVTNTIDCSAVMKVQRRINQERYEVGEVEMALATKSPEKPRAGSSSLCLSPLQPFVTGNIEDCIKEKHLHECLGCRYYAPSKEELRNAVELRKKQLDDEAKQLIEYIAQTRTGDTKKIDTDQLFLEVQTAAKRFLTASTEKAEEAEYKWRRHRDTQKSNF